MSSIAAETELVDATIPTKFTADLIDLPVTMLVRREGVARCER